MMSQSRIRSVGLLQTRMITGRRAKPYSSSISIGTLLTPLGIQNQQPLVVSLRSYSAMRRLASSSTGISGGGGAAAAMVPTHLPPVISPTATPPPPSNTRQFQKGFITQFMDRYSITKQENRIVQAEMLFQAATYQSQDPRWFGPGRIGRDFRSRHAVLTMHVWLLHKRLLADTYDKNSALSIDEEFFNVLWDDTTCRIRQTGVMEISVQKNLQKVQQYTFLHLTHYDHCYTAELLQDPAQRLEELRRLVWHHWFHRDPAFEKRYDHLDRIAWYVDTNYRNIMLQWPDEHYRTSRVEWVDLPNFDNLHDVDGSTLPPVDVHPEDVLPHPWRRHITTRGVSYYWNPETRQASWDKPPPALE